MPRLSLIGHLLFDHILSGNTGMIGSWNPEDVMSLHPFPSSDNIRQGLI
jgi:hypothetical protein